jgi:hypothetical protein
MKGQLGLSGIRVEEPIDKKLDFSPTLSCRSRDHHVHCVEVSGTIRTAPISNFIMQCQQRHFPALLTVAVPSGGAYSEFRNDQKWAREFGVGVWEVNHETSEVTSIGSALSLSLTGLTPADKKKYPAKYRGPLIEAETTFLNGSPAKGCSLVYDEIEDLTRKIAFKTHSQGFWKSPIKNPGKMLDKTPWKQVLEDLKCNLDCSKAKAAGKDLAGLSDVLLSRTIGITPHRNDSAHKPRNLEQLVKRDTMLRTRMEDAADLLHELIVASRCLRA